MACSLCASPPPHQRGQQRHNGRQEAVFKARTAETGRVALRGRRNGQALPLVHQQYLRVRDNIKINTCDNTGPDDCKLHGVGTAYPTSSASRLRDGVRILLNRCGKEASALRCARHHRLIGAAG
jgi:hypothetical protein